MLALRTLLEEGRFVSGEEMARHLNVSRSAVWKHLGRLRALGYRLEASPRRGYRLAGVPDTPFPWEIALHLPGHLRTMPIVYRPATSSTNDDARRLAEEGSPAPALVVAEEQTAGRGRLGRRWHSPPGGVYCSALLRPRLMPRQAPLVALGAALAVAFVLRRHASVDARIKWPNDVVAGRGKLAGVLAELFADQQAVRHVVVGIGINVHPPLAGTSLRNARGETGAPPGSAAPLPPVSLEEMGITMPRARLVALVVTALIDTVAALESGEAGAGQVVRELEQILAWRGERVDVLTASGVLAGTLVGLDPSGALRIASPHNGTERLILAGDVSLRPLPQA